MINFYDYMNNAYENIVYYLTSIEQAIKDWPNSRAVLL